MTAFILKIYLTSLAINENTLSFIIENQLKGLSFLKVEGYSLGKTTRFTTDQIVCVGPSLMRTVNTMSTTAI
jgi:hypothetical protein